MDNLHWKRDTTLPSNQYMWLLVRNQYTSFGIVKEIVNGKEEWLFWLQPAYDVVKDKEIFPTLEEMKTAYLIAEQFSQVENEPK